MRTSMKKYACVAVMLTVAVSGGAPALGQATQPADPLAVKPLQEGWEEIDSRMVFLTVQLSSVEASLAAVNQAILRTGAQKDVQKSSADQYQRGNELMDRNGGGPVPWSEFYGRTANKFFHRPAPNEASLSVRILRPRNEVVDQPGQVMRQPTAPSNRPPQFDYIYRANMQAKAKAEADAAALGNKVDLLQNRRRQLESEQSLLWCQIVARSVACRSLSEKPWYRLGLSGTETVGGAAERLAAAQAASRMIRTHLSVLEKLDDEKHPDEGVLYRNIEQIARNARREFADTLYAQTGMQQEIGDLQHPVGRLAALAKRAYDLAKNMDDAYQVAQESDSAGDLARKGTSRGQLQSSLVDYAETILAMDEVYGVMLKEWALSPTPGKPVEKIDTTALFAAHDADKNAAAPTHAPEKNAAPATASASQPAADKATNLVAWVVQQRYFTYTIGRHPARVLELRSDGTTGEGGAKMERQWRVEGDRIILSGRSGDCELAPQADGSYHGKWRTGERAILVPSSGGH